ncbi:hypothetical protein NO135_21475, partial [Clostridioides difficile]|nr:hypothetical protein [Clostridioides difficile]
MRANTSHHRTTKEKRLATHRKPFSFYRPARTRSADRADFVASGRLYGRPAARRRQARAELFGITCGRVAADDVER